MRRWKFSSEHFFSLIEGYFQIDHIIPMEISKEICRMFTGGAVQANQFIKFVLTLLSFKVF